MKRARRISALLFWLMLLSMLVLAACSSGNLGNEGIAFVRDGSLWTIAPDGTNLFEAVKEQTPVVGYGLSPDHRIFVFRTLDSDFAKTPSGQHLSVSPVTGLTGDVPSALNTVGIDGGSPIPIILSTPQLARSNAWWSPNGTRLLYREGADAQANSPDLVTWWISQNDQPAGIARKFLPNSLSIPSINSSSSMTIGSSQQGIFSTTLAGTDFMFVQRGALPGHPLPASLERVLWQPVQQNPALLYAVTSQTAGNGQFDLLLRESNGQTRVLASCACRQFAWSPDGKRILYSTNEGYILLNIQDNSSFSFSAEHGAVPYWSPDGQRLLLDGLHTLTLVQVTSQQTRVLLSDGNAPLMSDGTLPSSTTFLQPVANNLWDADSQRFVLVTRGRTLWQGQQLASGNGLYVISLNGQGTPQEMPKLIDNNGHDTQPGWSYVNPNTSFLS